MFDDPSTLPPAALGPYRVLHQIGSGVLGPVYRAFDRQADRLIVIKTFHLSQPPEAIARVTAALRQLAAMPALDPALVTPIDAGLEGTSPFLVMPLANGESLDVVARQEAPMPIRRVARLLAPVARALDAAAAIGFRHGALHPRDILVDPATMDVRVTGIGVVLLLEALSLKAPVRRPYTAPERAAGQAWDARADVYSLGVIAHELLTGRRPGATGEQDGSLASDVTPEQRVQVRQVLAGALADDPDARYPSATAFSEALDRVAGGRPAAPPAIEAHVEEIPVESPVAVEPAAAVAVPVIVPPVPVTAPMPAKPVFRAPRPFAIDTPTLFETPPPSRTGRKVLTGLAVTAAGLTIGIALGLRVGVRRLTPAAPAAARPVAETSGDTEVAVPAPVATETAANPPAAEPVPAPPPPPATRVAAVPGRLLVRSTPAGAIVTINGTLYGETPVVIRDLALGAHSVQVARPGHLPYVERIVLTHDTPARSLAVTLQKGIDVGGPRRGTIDVDSTPRGARVRIDGRVIGTTPLRWPDASPGTHEVQIDLAGYQLATAPVLVRVGESVRVALTLRAVR